MAVTINGTTGIETNTDTGKVKVGASDDLQLYHYSDNSYIENSTGHLIINSSATTNVDIMKAGHSEYLARFKPDGAVELYYDNSKKLNTYASGITVTGHVDVLSGSVYLEDNGKAIFGTGSDLQISHDGSHSYINHSGTGNFYIYGNGVSDLVLRADPNKESIKCIHDAAVSLYYDNALKFETTQSGVSVPISTSGHGPAITTTGDVYPQITLGANRSSENNSLGYVVARWNTADVAAIDFVAGADTTNKDDGKIGFNTRPSGGGMTRRMTIDSNGYVTTPNQPRFCAEKNGSGSTTTTANATQVFQSEAFDIGGHYNNSTGVFTAPVAGCYYFYVQMLGGNNDSRVILTFNKNNSSNLMEISGTTDNYNSIKGSLLVSLAANDTMRIKNENSTVDLYHDSGYQNQFMGWLVA